ncbi:hypothetical protein Pmani_002784 [Petrolisthes manimaculis]|uniref:Uncharacterized protein n=1 Tax=Petrolisthes manimaculis TaxID=1843537 RepID=A0AAE1QJV7_9EUCA|nr:hypothetical protein Pmani_002772 [Petrolisthes manimaculis]KAK4326767.1 hypothetical protein Pmani_002784 [Petrolisthes manimaculis]
MSSMELVMASVLRRWSRRCSGRRVRMRILVDHIKRRPLTANSEKVLRKFASSLTNITVMDCDVLRS